MTSNKLNFSVFGAILLLLLACRPIKLVNSEYPTTPKLNPENTLNSNTEDTTSYKDKKHNLASKSIGDSLNQGIPIFIQLAEDVSIKLNKIENVPQIISKVFPNTLITSSVGLSGYSYHYFVWLDDTLFDLNQEYNKVLAKMSNAKTLAKIDIILAYTQIAIGFESDIKFSSIVQIDTIVDEYNNGNIVSYNYKIDAIVSEKKETILVKTIDDEIDYIFLVNCKRSFAPFRQPEPIKL